MSAGRTILKNFLSLTISNSISKAAGLVTVIYLARVLGPAEFGKMNFALALVSYFAVLSHLGLSTIGVRELAQSGGNQSECINRILSLKILLGLGSFLLLGIFVFFLHEPGDLKRLAFFYGLTLFTSNVLPFDWVFQGIEKMEYLGFSAAVQGITYLVLILLAVKGSGDLLLIPWILLAAQGGAVLFMYLSYRRLFPGFKPAFIRPAGWGMLRQALPVAIWGILIVITLNAGITILGFLKSAEEVGYYSAAYKIIWIVAETLVAYVGAVFPTMAKHHAFSSENFKMIMDHTLKWVTLVSFPAIAGIFMLSEPITAAIYGNKFWDSATLLAILTPVPYLIFLTSLCSHALIAAHRQDEALKLSAMQAVLSVGLSLALIPAYGAMGLAVATVLASAAADYLYLRETGKFARLEKYRPYKPFAASVIMALALWHASDLGLFVSVPLGAAVYAAAILLLKGVTAADLRGIKQQLFPEKAGPANHEK